MEPAKIDWKYLEWRFVEDKAYEQINAPKWFDFLNQNEHNVDDQAWFCRPECNHPKTVEDFLKSPPSKVPSPSIVSEVSPLGDKLLRDVKLKRRGLTNTSIYPTNNSRFREDGENQNPNLATPQLNQAKAMKAAIKSSTEKKQPIENEPENNEVLPKLKSTLSARNLFAGRDILNQITDFCTELKRMAMRARERENVEVSDVRKSLAGPKEEVVKECNVEILGELKGKRTERMPLLEALDVSKSLAGSKEEVVKECSVEILGELKGKKTERMPLLEAGIGKMERQAERLPLLGAEKRKTGRMPLLEMGLGNNEGMDGSIIKEKLRRKKRGDEAENFPVSLNLETIKHKGGGEGLVQIRTNPPSPQCFSATRPSSKVTPSKASKSKLMERGILEEAEQNKKLIKEDFTEKGKSVCTVDGREARTLDVFWFLKPCTTLSS